MGLGRLDLIRMIATMNDIKPPRNQTDYTNSFFVFQTGRDCFFGLLIGLPMLDGFISI